MPLELLGSYTIEAVDGTVNATTVGDAVIEIPIEAAPTAVEIITQGAQGIQGPVGPTGEPLILPPVNLTDAATILVDALLGAVMRVTLGGNRTLGNPTNPQDSQMIMFEIKQDGTGSRTLALASKYNFGTDLTSITLSTAPGVTDKLLVHYVLARDEWDVIGFKKGF